MGEASRPFQWPSTPFKHRFLGGRSESPEDAAVPPLTACSSSEDTAERTHPWLQCCLGQSDSWGPTASLLSGSWQVQRSGWYCEAERSWELADCFFSVWQGKRICLLELSPYFQSKPVVMCGGVTSAGRFIQKIGQKQIIWEYRGRLISPLYPAIPDVARFKLVTSPCNLLIFPCQEALAALYLQRGD